MIQQGQTVKLTSKSTDYGCKTYQNLTQQEDIHKLFSLVLDQLEILNKSTSQRLTLTIRHKPTLN